MKDSLVQQCLDILKREDIKNELKLLFRPIFDASCQFAISTNKADWRFYL